MKYTSNLLKYLNLRISGKRNSPERSYYILGSELDAVRSATDLGGTITSDLKWTDNILSIVAKANRMMGFIKHNWSKDLNRDSVMTLYKLLVRSHLCYASQLWAALNPQL